ncbi:centrosomal protein of 162 kDa isoform X1 [Aplysia californica]|uniref:Centrosomal protein of 162 kDa n=1 Tax=Aplysia californica TaxID=6500 RepID=A0ABM1AA22_APLCA|nr:centrosomal protein of 162 kDa isoform X1 [Aplysia californica]
MERNSRRWTKEDLENTFEEFLKTSLSSEEDTDKIKKLLEQPVKKKSSGQSSLWWANDSDDESLKKGTGKSFLKTKESSEPPVRSKSILESDVRGKGKSVSKPSLSKQTTSPKRVPRKDRPKSKRETSPGKTRGSKSKIDTSMSKDSLEDISERSEEHDHHEAVYPMQGSNTVISIHDSSIDTSASYEGVPSNTNREKPGCDTLDEMADKQQFFQNLEKSADGTVDYGKLNQELSQTGGTMMLSPGVKVNQPDISFVSGLSPAVENAKTPSKDSNMDITDSQQKPSMLSKVALLDSMDSTLNTTTSPKLNSRDTTQDNLGVTLPDAMKTPVLSAYSGQMGTNTSREMEDLQRVLQEAGLSPTIYGPDSRPPTGKGSQQTSTPAQEKKEVDRSVGDIIREMDAIDRRGREIETTEDNVQLRSNYKSPRSPRSPGLHRQLNTEDAGGFDNSHTEDTEVFQPVTSVGAHWSQRLVKSRKKEGRSVSRQESKPASLPSEGDRGRPLRDRFAHVQSSGYGRPTSPPSRPPRSRSAGKSPSKRQNSSPGGSSRSRGRGRKDSSPSSDLQRILGRAQGQDPNLERSIEIFTKYITQHLAAEQTNDTGNQLKTEWAKRPGHEREAALIDEMRDLREQLNAERIMKSKLQTDATGTEKELKKQLSSQKLKYEDEVFTLKQENFVLSAKLKELEGDKASKAKMSEGSSVQGSCEDPQESQTARLEREVQEQENLLAGYQAENKRLYEEIKGLQSKAKVTEGSMFKENQRLTSELTNLRQELELKNSELQNKGVITSMTVQQQIATGNAQAAIGATQISHLEGELAEVKRTLEQHCREVKLLQQEKFEMERQMQGLIKERDGIALKLMEGLTSEQVKEVESKHKEENEKLQRKLRWYAENQELLDKSNARIRVKDEEIHRLKLRLEDFKSEAGRKLEENKIRSKEKAASAKKIQDLERQVKEMEHVIRRRHPNSLPAMMMVAATVPDPVTDNNLGKGRTAQVLESRIAKLEKELESRDELAQQDVRAVEQKYNYLKLQYDERIADLERQLSLYRADGAPSETSALRDHPHSHALALERELDMVKDRSRKQLAETQAEVDRLTAELNKVRKNQENMMMNESRQHEEVWKSQVHLLKQELKDREHDIQLLQHTVERMRARAGKPKGSQGKNSSSQQDWPPFPHAPSASKNYQPDNFADGDMTTLMQENQMLKAKIDQLQLEFDQQRVELRRLLAETEAVARQNTERLENQIEVMRSSHQKELQRLVAEQALQVSSSRSAELQSKCDTQEVMIRHLQAQLKKAAGEAEQMIALRQKESQLSTKVNELQDKLREAKLQQTPEMRHFESLEDKLAEMVEKQRRREAELDSVVKQNQQSSRVEVEEEVDKWKRVVEAKNQQLQVFRAELDSILDVLRTLQRQGVKLPVGNVYS